MKKCTVCKHDFPEHLVIQMVRAGPGMPLNYLECCPLCALIERNETAEIPLGTPFNGEQAHRLFKEAFRYAIAKGWIPKECQHEYD